MEASESNGKGRGWNPGHFIGYLFPSSFSWLDSFPFLGPAYRLNSFLFLYISVSFSLNDPVSSFIHPKVRRIFVSTASPSFVLSFVLSSILYFIFNHSQKWRRNKRINTMSMKLRCDTCRKFELNKMRLELFVSSLIWRILRNKEIIWGAEQMSGS